MRIRKDFCNVSNDSSFITHDILQLVLNHAIECCVIRELYKRFQVWSENLSKKFWVERTLRKIRG